VKIKWREDKIRLEDKYLAERQDQREGISREDKIRREDSLAGRSGRYYGGKKVIPTSSQSTVLKSCYHSLRHYRKGRKTADVNMEMVEIKSRLMFY
jgi:hypothetical protein